MLIKRPLCRQGFRSLVFLLYIRALMKKFVPVLIFIVISCFAGYLSMLLQSSSLATWYPTLAKSSLTPPGHVVSVAWSILYLLMGTAAGIIWSERTTFSWVLTGMFFSQLGLNVLWSFCFFYLQSPIFGFAALIILILFLLVYVSGCYMQKPLAAYLNIPYLAWLLFAAYLNGYVMFNN